MTSTATPDVSNGGVYYQFGGPVVTSDVFVFTLSDGRQFAITGYDDAEAHDLLIGIPADDSVNLSAWGINDGGTFSVYAYSDATLGALIHTYTHGGGGVYGSFQFLYDPAADDLSMSYQAVSGNMSSSTGAYASYAGATVFADAPICFLRGTRILTDRGEVAVEDLAAGDLVATRSGALRPIRWIGTQSFASHRAGSSQQPIRLRAGSLGAGLPDRDLLVSPGHAVLVGAVLVHAGALVNNITILRAVIAGRIDYFHLDLGPHDCVRANGAWAESYFEDRNRDGFHNAASFHAGTPGHAAERQPTCLSIVTATDPRLPALRANLAPNLTADPDLHLLADGNRIALRAGNDAGGGLVVRC
jgi:hypothetical protein